MGLTHSSSSRRSPRLLALGAAALLASVIAVLAIASTASAVLSGEFGYQRRAKPTIKVEPLQYHNGPVLHSSDSYTIYWDPVESYRGYWKELINGYMSNVGADRTNDDVFAVNAQYRDSGGGAANDSTFRGSYTDKDAYPTSGGCSETATFACLTDAQIRAELQHVISSGALPGATGPAVYYLLTPPGVVVCTDEGGHGNCSNSTSSKPSNGICGYHSAINPGGAGQVIYAVQPWVAGDAGFIEQAEPAKTAEPTEDVFACQANAEPLEEPNQIVGLDPWGDYAVGLADVIINDLSIEQSNIVVDPLLNGWYQSATNAEQGDICKWDFGAPPESPPTPDHHTHAATLSDETINGQPYYLQWAFDSTWLTIGRPPRCWGGNSFVPHFTAPNPVNSGDVIGFDGTESLLTLQAAAGGLPADEPYLAPVYSWNFGDGTTISGTTDASVFHAYQYGGEYEVTLTVKDSGDTTGSYIDTITVVGPPRPDGGGGGGGSTGGGSGSSSPSSTGAGAGATVTHTAGKITATQTVLSHSLASALRNGLAIHYSVNEQVAGRFEVLLARSLARRVGLHGATATGLAKGTAPQTVIAKAILVTTKGGRSTYRVKFGKATAARLRRLRKVTLMIRMVVHNASSPVATTVLDTVNLR